MSGGAYARAPIHIHISCAVDFIHLALKKTIKP